MLCTLNEAHRMFLEKYPNIAIGYSKFSQLKPANVKLNSDLSQMVCLCKYHENFRYGPVINY
jgi:hypothetical protein